MKRGFTLIELLAVITVLAIIGLIATTTISYTVKENQDKAYNTQIDNIIRGARDWSAKHVFELPDRDGESIIVTLGQLQQEGMVPDDIRNPKNSQLFDSNMEIRITHHNSDYKYEIVE